MFASVILRPPANVSRHETLAAARRTAGSRIPARAKQEEAEAVTSIELAKKPSLMQRDDMIKRQPQIFLFSSISYFRLFFGFRLIFYFRLILGLRIFLCSSV